MYNNLKIYQISKAIEWEPPVLKRSKLFCFIFGTWMHTVYIHCLLVTFWLKSEVTILNGSWEAS